MSFNPIFPYYIKMAASQSYIEPSSSLGATQMAAIKSNLEWDYHHINSQTRINIQTHTNNSAYYEKQISYTLSGSNVLIYSFGPFKINFDKKGNPQPLYVAMVPGLQVVDAASYVTGTYTVQLRSFDSQGNKFEAEIGTYVSTSQTQATNLNKSWQHLSTPNASYISASMGASSSVLITDMSSLPYKLQTRTSKSLAAPDSSQDVMLAYMDVYFRIDSYHGTPSLNATINGLYVKEVNIIGEKWL